MESGVSYEGNPGLDEQVISSLRPNGENEPGDWESGGADDALLQELPEEIREDAGLLMNSYEAEDDEEDDLVEIDEAEVQPCKSCGPDVPLMKRTGDIRYLSGCRRADGVPIDDWLRYSLRQAASRYDAIPARHDPVLETPGSHIYRPALYQDD